MLDVTQRQLVRVWHHLEQAAVGKASHGYVAEVYAYAVSPRDPAAEGGPADGGIFGRAARLSQARLAERSLAALLRLFVDVTGCTVEVDGLTIEGWERAGDGFSHRCHVRVTEGP
jgi:hypothetical protein